MAATTASAHEGNDGGNAAAVADRALGEEATAAMPPGMAEKRQYTADDLIKQMNKVPLFMTSIDEADEEQAEQLAALRALAYDGTRADIAANFKDQGNDCVRQRKWPDAREFYGKAIAAVRDPDLPRFEDDPDAKVVDLDDAAAAANERALEEACLANRALCNLEMSIYGPTTTSPRDQPGTPC